MDDQEWAMVGGMSLQEKITEVKFKMEKAEDNYELEKVTELQ